MREKKKEGEGVKSLLNTRGRAKRRRRSEKSKVNKSLFLLVPTGKKERLLRICRSGEYKKLLFLVYVMFVASFSHGFVVCLELLMNKEPYCYMAEKN